MNALEGFVPPDIIKTLNAFLDFCYIARQNVLTEDSLDALDAALERFHHYCEIFWASGVRSDGFSLPRQHSLKHYRRHIENFGAPNGLCSSITESKHITAVKKPWRRSSWYEALKQMLTINTRTNKLAVARVDFSSRGMLQGTCLGEAIRLQYPNLNNDANGNHGDEFGGPDGNGEDGSDLNINQDDSEDDGSPGPVDGPSTLSEVVLAQKKGSRAVLISGDCTKNLDQFSHAASKYPCASFEVLGEHINQVNLDDLVQHFLFYQQSPTFAGTPPLRLCPPTENVKNISVFHSATAVFCAPSNFSGVGGLYCETIRCTP